jgi:hypothetical protein
MQLEFLWENEESTINDWRNIKDPKLRKKMRKKAYYQSNKEKCKQQIKTHYENNREKISERKRNWRKNNKLKIQEYQKAYYQRNKNKLAQKESDRRKTNIQFKLRKNLRIRLNKALKGNSKFSSAVKDLGCTIDELKIYLQSKFQKGMTWDNWSRDGWHIDHIRPLSSFDLTNKEQLLQAVHYTNLQPLWAKDNLSKNNKH